MLEQFFRILYSLHGEYTFKKVYRFSHPQPAQGEFGK
jgi:hypothetical protein